MEYFNIYYYVDNIKLDNTGSVIEPELPDRIEQFIDTGDGIVKKGIMKGIEELNNEKDDIIITKLNTKGDVTTIKIFVIED